MTVPAAQLQGGATGEMRRPAQLGGMGPQAGWSRGRRAELAQHQSLPDPPARRARAPPETGRLMLRLQYSGESHDDDDNDGGRHDKCSVGPRAAMCCYIVERPWSSCNPSECIRNPACCGHNLKTVRASKKLLVDSPKC